MHLSEQSNAVKSTTAVCSINYAKTVTALVTFQHLLLYASQFKFRGHVTGGKWKEGEGTKLWREKGGEEMERIGGETKERKGEVMESGYYSVSLISFI